MWWLVLRILWSIVPAIMRAIKEQQIKKAAVDDVVEALHERIERAKRAEVPDGATDKYNRAKRDPKRLPKSEDDPA